MPPDLAFAHQRLTDLKNELTDLSDGSRGDRAIVQLDQQSVGRLSRMDSLQRQAMAQAAERQRLQQLHRVDAAFRRIEDDDYGYCETCGEEIPAARLEIDPTAFLCVNCARLSEG